MKNSLSFFAFAPAFLLFGSTPIAVSAEDDPTFSNLVYLIRNGEMVTNKVGSGLSEQGEESALCFMDMCSVLYRQVFEYSSDYHIGYIIAEPPKKGGNDTVAIETIRATPLAMRLSLTLYTSCDRHDKDRVGDASAFAATSDASILICWEQEYLVNISVA